MLELLSQDIWQKLANRFERHGELRAAIAYVTAEHVPFGQGDLLVCDASDVAIRNGSTSVELLAKFVAAGVHVYSYQGLHAKVTVVDGVALIGSANMSENAGVRTLEVSLLTDDVEMVRQTSQLIDDVVADSVRVTGQFLRRAEKIPVERGGTLAPIERTDQQVPMFDGTTGIRVKFQTRRNNKSLGQEQYLIRMTREDSEKLAEHVPALGDAIAQDETWRCQSEVRWRNGKCADFMAFSAYKGWSGAMTLTAWQIPTYSPLPESGMNTARISNHSAAHAT